MCLGSSPSVPPPAPLPPPPIVEEEERPVEETVKRARQREKRKQTSTQGQLVKTSAAGLLAPAKTQAQALIGGDGG